MECKKLLEASIFKNMKEEEIEVMLECMKSRKRTYQKGEIIFHAGESIQEMGLILKGTVMIEYNDVWGKRNIIDLAIQGQIFGETFASLPEERMMFNAVAAEDSEIIMLNIHKVTKLCNNACVFHQKMIENLLAISAQKNLKLSRRIFFTTPRTIRGRLTSYLSSYSIKAGSREFDIPFNRQQLADYLNIDRSALSNELGKMQKEGLIEVNKNHFIIKGEEEIV